MSLKTRKRNIKNKKTKIRKNKKTKLRKNKKTKLYRKKKTRRRVKKRMKGGSRFLSLFSRGKEDQIKMQKESYRYPENIMEAEVKYMKDILNIKIKNSDFTVRINNKSKFDGLNSINQTEKIEYLLEAYKDLINNNELKKKTSLTNLFESFVKAKGREAREEKLIIGAILTYQHIFKFFDRVDDHDKDFISMTVALESSKEKCEVELKELKEYLEATAGDEATADAAEATAGDEIKHEKKKIENQKLFYTWLLDNIDNVYKTVQKKNDQIKEQHDGYFNTLGVSFTKEQKENAIKFIRLYWETHYGKYPEKRKDFFKYVEEVKKRAKHNANVWERTDTSDLVNPPQ